MAVHAETSLRVGDKVLTIGDTAARVTELMGQPTVRTFLNQPNGGLPNQQLSPGEQWQYAQDGKTVVVTIVNGKVTDFETQYH
ncbi:DUF2845 domain-containing protein [Dyella choica]|nr:DUF2845 domain-containing protein [Dyella choica]